MRKAREVFDAPFIEAKPLKIDRDFIELKGQHRDLKKAYDDMKLAGKEEEKLSEKHCSCTCEIC